MTGAAADKERGSWTAPGHSRSIEYATAVLTGIRADAIEGFNKLPHGGVEVGGVLFGTKDLSCVKALRFRPVLCEYAYGPSFTLSEKDQAGLKELLSRAPADDELRGLIPVGWYHSHTRSEIFLSERDLELFNRFFPEPWQIALVVRPANFSPTGAGFFFREPNGKILAERSYSEFTIPASFGAQALSVLETAPAPADGDYAPIPVPQAAPHTGTQTERPGTQTEPQPEIGESSQHYTRNGAWIAASCLLFVALALGGWRAWTQFRPQVLSHETAARTDPHQLRIRQLELQADLLRRKLAEQSNQNTVLQQMVTELKNRPAPVIAPPTSPTEVRRTGEASRTAPPRSKSQGKSAAKSAASGAIASQSVKREPPKMTRLPITQIAVSRPAQTPLLGPPPAVTSAAPATSLPKIEQLPAFPAPEKASPPARPVHSGPVVGRLIWTGRLQRNAWVVIEGRNVSTGSLTGELPARPVHINVYPADLMNDGLVLYSANIKYAKKDTEPPGQHNGWNRTAYTWNPQHAQDVAVTEAPSSANNWSRVALRANNPVSVIVIDWSLAQ
jgi:proteasome lid subunit RPN8/RPN11